MTPTTGEAFLMVGIAAALVATGLSLVIGILPAVLIVAGGTLYLSIS